MNYIEINGDKHPFRRSMNAMVKFEAEFKEEGITTSRPELWKTAHLLFFIWCCMEAGAKFAGKQVTYDLGQLGDALTDADIAKFTEATQADAEDEKKSTTRPQRRAATRTK